MASRTKRPLSVLVIATLLLLLAIRRLHSLANATNLHPINANKSARFSLAALFGLAEAPPAHQSQAGSAGWPNSKQLGPAPKCGRRRKHSAARLAAWSPRIVNGRPASIHHFPWLVSLQREHELLWGYKAFYHSCGASIISRSWILTAAHCLHKRQEPLRAVAGTSKLKHLHRAQIRPIQRQIQHPNFDLNSYDNDIALLKTSLPFELDSAKSPVGLVCLDNQLDIQPYDIATICGFGAHAFKQQVRSHLYETEIAIIDRATCNASFANSITHNMICAGGMVQNKRDACSGDSGGPLLMQALDGDYSIQVGIVSFGNNCAVKNFPGVYTRLSNYYEWIIANIDEPLGRP